MNRTGSEEEFERDIREYTDNKFMQWCRRHRWTNLKLALAGAALWLLMRSCGT